eukprot:Em0018g603a
MVPTIYGLSNSVAIVKYSDLLPTSLDYYFYNGSLTVPGCGEVVQWYVLKNTIDIPIAFLNTMRTVQITSGSNVTLPYNIRNLQALHGRTVYSCQGTGCITSSGFGEKASAILMTFVGCLAIYLAN